jgi:NADH:ubiquinone oxidoreductase subunit 3 (subunit A)
MPSGWEVYYVMLLSAVFALCVPLTLRLISLLISFRGRRGEAEKTPPKESAIPLGRKINTRFFLGANVALLLLAFGLALIPCVAASRDGAGGAISVLSLAGLAALGLLYAARKGDLTWLKTFRGKQE